MLPHATKDIIEDQRDGLSSRNDRVTFEKSHQSGGNQESVQSRRLTSINGGERCFFIECRFLQDLRFIGPDIFSAARFRPLPVCYCNPKCSCGALGVIQKHREDDLVICLLKGLNENYSGVRFQIMLINPLPNLGKVMEILQDRERQLLQEGTLSTPQETQRGSNSQGKRAMCTYCGLLGHTIERCYKKHGYPPRFNQSKQGERSHYDHLDARTSSEVGSFQGLTPSWSNIEHMVTGVQAESTQLRLVSHCQPRLDMAGKDSQHTSSPWPHLQAEILAMISDRLEEDIGNLRLRSVCSNWRSTVPLRKPELWASFKPPFPAFINPNRPGNFILSSSTIYLLQSAQPTSPWWLIRLERKRGFGKFRPLSPFSRTMTEDHTPKSFPRGLNLLDVRIREIGKAYSLDFFEHGKKMETNLYEMSLRKVVMSSVPWTRNSGEEGGYAVLALFSGKLAFIKLGDENWSQIDCLGGATYYDILYSKKKDVFYALDTLGRLVVIIDKDLKAKKIVSKEHFCYSRSTRKERYLIESNGDLFLVHMLPERDYSILEVFEVDVLKLNKKRGDWDYYVDSLGSDQVFFVGDDCSYAVPAQEFGLEGNCIYIADERFMYDNEQDGKHGGICLDGGVYCFTDGTCGPFASYPDRCKIFLNSPEWLNGPEAKAGNTKGKKRSSKKSK
ncbi:unnamed protein product [Cuscuta campestris]|uniref:KIB1-4 beta-propeller domain-containing protein n=1 Tax=Cuscuta campestris TaxID=132261 RepID=A0A484MWX9_9ASTE|nr:unnamed protein product [Cuscuta campestris]